MKSFRLLLVAVTSAFLFTMAMSTATAGSMGNGAVQRQRLVVDSIDATAGTVVFKSMIDQSVHSYKIDTTTLVRVGTGKGTLDQIQVGMKVYQYAGEGGKPPKEGQTLSALGVNPAAPASK